MAPRPPRRRPLTRPFLLAVAFCAFIYYFLLSDNSSNRYGRGTNTRSSPKVFGAVSLATLDDLGLTEKECRDTFPGLMDEIDRAVANGPFDVNVENSKALIGTVRGGDLYIRRPPGKGQLSRHMKEVRLLAPLLP